MTEPIHRTERHDLDAAEMTRANMILVGQCQLVAGSQLLTPDELNAEAVRFAIRAGWRGDQQPIPSALDLFDQGREWVTPDVLSVSEALSWDADEAVEYLNDYCAPFGCVVVFDDGLFLQHMGEEG